MKINELQLLIEGIENWVKFSRKGVTWTKAWGWKCIKPTQGLWVIHSGQSTKSVGELMGDETMREK